MPARVLAFDTRRAGASRVRIAAVVTALVHDDDARGDERAVSRFLAGDVTGFEFIVRRYSGMVFGLAARLVGPLDAEDVVQETFLRAFRSLESFRGESTLKTWLYAIALNRIRVRRGTLARVRALFGGGGSGPTPDFSLLDTATDPERTPEQNALLSDQRRRLRKAVHALPEEFRMAVVLRDLEGLSYEEVASVLSVPVGTVRSRLARGRALLKEALT